MNLELDGRVALASDCLQGLEYACIRTLARHGADISGVSIGDDSVLKEEMKALGRSCHSLTVSLTTPGSIHGVMKEVLAAHGHVDILLSFAGILKKGDTLEVSRQTFQGALGINVTAAFTLPQEVIRQSIRQGHGGEIINAPGILPYGTSEYCTYFTSKGAVEAMAKYMAHRFAGRDIQINAITLGSMNERNRLQSGNGQNDDLSASKEILAGRRGTWQDLDGLPLVLCNAAGNYINGACIPLDGGYSIWCYVGMDYFPFLFSSFIPKTSPRPIPETSRSAMQAAGLGKPVRCLLFWVPSVPPYAVLRSLLP